MFAFTDVAAIGALRALADGGRGVPDDVQVIGFDNLGLGELTIPALSSVDPDNAAMARTICRLLIEQLAGERAPGERSVVTMPAAVVERGSTRPG